MKEDGSSSDENYDNISAATKGYNSVANVSTRDGSIKDKYRSPIDMQDINYNVRPFYKRFPLSIVWTPLPCLTQLVPVIGHTGIGDSKGVLHDFAGPYYVSVDDLAFGETHKYVVLELEGVTPEQYDQAIKDADKTYCKRMHNICCDNCHSHVARVLNNLNYKGRSNYTMIDVWWMCLVNSKYVSILHVFYTYIFWIFVAIIYLVSYLTK